MFFQSKKTIHYINQFHTTHDISNWFAAFSIDVWEQLKLFREEGKSLASVDERTLNDQLVIRITQLLKTEGISLPIRLFRARNEAINGADLDIIVQLDKDKNIYFPCQAKRLYVEKNKTNILNAKYEKLDYRNKNGEQKKLLIDHAKRTHGFPLYMLYNYSEYDFPVNPQYPDKELYGCTLISALYLKNNPSLEPTVPSLHPPAKPLTSLMKLKDANKLNSFWGNASIKHNAAFLTDRTIFGDGGWEEFGPPRYPPKRFVSSINMNEVLANNYSNNRLKYSPKFRIVFTKESLGLIDRNINF